MVLMYLHQQILQSLHLRCGLYFTMKSQKGNPISKNKLNTKSIALALIQLGHFTPHFNQGGYWPPLFIL